MRWSRAADVAYIADADGLAMTVLNPPDEAVPVQLNPTGALIWQLLDDRPRGLDDLAQRVSAATDHPTDWSRSVLRVFLPDLVAQRLARASSDEPA
ncbi:PqqD family protein [Luteipulveratus mongoliensis]|nr:PqqD family protein [Luteipulveratus mongoliensis]